MHINLPKSLIVLPGAVTPKGVHLVANCHSSMVDSPRPSFQVHRPAQHSTRCETSDHHFVACLDSIKPPPLTLGNTMRGAALCLWAHWAGSGSWRQHKGELFLLLAKGCSALLLLTGPQAPILSKLGEYFKKCAIPAMLFLMSTLPIPSQKCSKYRIISINMHHLCVKPFKQPWLDK